MANIKQFYNKQNKFLKTLDNCLQNKKIIKPNFSVLWFWFLLQIEGLNDVKKLFLNQ